MFDTIFEACLPLLSPSAASEPFVFGMIGGVTRSASAPLTVADLDSLLVPGLAALNVIAERLPVPLSDPALTRLLRERLRYGIQIPVFAVPSTDNAPNSDDAQPVHTTGNCDGCDRSGTDRMAPNRPEPSGLNRPKRFAPRSHS